MSTHLRTLSRRNLVLLGVAVILSVILVVRPDAVTSIDKEKLPAAFPEFERDAIRRVELRQPGADAGADKVIQLELDAGGNTWNLASHFGYPSQAGAARLLDAIGSARVRAEVTRREETFAKYAPDTGWIDVTLVDVQGKDALTFGIGNYAYPETFLRVGTGDAARVIKVLNLSPGDARVDAGSWIETRIWPGLSATDAIRIDVEQREDKRTLSFVKRGEAAADVEMEAPEAIKDDADKIWWMASPDAGDAKKLAVEDLLREFTGLLIQDVVAGESTGPAAAEFGFDDPTIVTRLWTRPQGGSVAKSVLTIGKRVEGKEQWYVRRDGARWVFTVSAASLSRQRQMPGEFRAPAPVKDEIKAPKDDAEPKKDDADPKKDDAEPKKDDAEPKKDAAEPKKDDADPKKADAEPKKDK